MRDYSKKNYPVVDWPICRLKEEYKEPLRRVYEKYHLPISEMTDEMIDEFMPILT
jgi:hypothetical protein